MKTLEKITELQEIVRNAQTSTLEGRSQVVESCKELYHLIEEDIFNAGMEWMIGGIYKDLTTGNFAEPFMCEQKKTDFNVVVQVYQERVLPRL